MREWAVEETYRPNCRNPTSVMILIPITFMLLNIVVYYWNTDIQGKVLPDQIISAERRRLLMKTDIAENNCTRPAMYDFPQLSFPAGETGQLILPFVVSIYLYILLARVCDGYFIASIRVICSKVGFSGDVAGATLMASATSSPELFVNLVGTFVTNGNIGVGTIIGSAVFNILAVPGLCSFFATSKVIVLDWWPLTRDSIAYCISLLILCLVLRDGVIQWYEALFMVASYTFYLVMMHYNDTLRETFQIWCDSLNTSGRKDDSATCPLLAKSKKGNGHVKYIQRMKEDFQNDDEDFEESRHACCWPPGSSLMCKLWWILTLPISIILACTIPNCRTRQKLYLLTFTMCVCWIAIGSYLIAWMITISGFVLKIPDSVMGLTFIAAGMCIPETISSIIVSKQGQGSMALANALGSNIFDTLFCFGVPWLIKSTYFLDDPSNNHSLQVDSARLEYDTLILLITLVILFTIVTVNNFQLTKIGGYTCLMMYFIFIGFSVGIELYAHCTSNPLPPCNVVSHI